MAMMTASELLDWLGKNQFLPAYQVDALRPLLPSFVDGHAFARELIQRNWLSPYQVNQILQGKGDLLIVGANRLLERLGEGTMGQVFKAWNTRLSRVVAVKMIHKEHLANSKAIDRFHREIVTASQLDHPNIVLVRDADECGDRPYLVMDFIDGIDLAQRVRQQGPLPLAQAVSFAHQAALGLQHAFERGVVHRDIKPGNLMLVGGGVSGESLQGSAGETTFTPQRSPFAPQQIKILDFGLSRFESETRNANRLTYAGNLIGTVDYIAPEQAQDAHAADLRADIYSLGCTLFYLLTGKPPFPGATVVEKVIARTTGNPPSVRAVRPEVPAGLDAVMLRLMARQPERRYATPQEAAQALAPYTFPGGCQAGASPWAPGFFPAYPGGGRAAAPIPVTQMVLADVPLVQAVSADVAPEVQAVPVATPAVINRALVPDASPSGEHDPFLPSGDVNSPAAPAAARPAFRRTWLLPAAGAGVALVAVAIVLVVVPRGSGPSGPSKRGYAPSAALHLLPLGPISLKEGKKSPVIVRIERKDFSGPVKVRFENLPDGFQSEEIVFGDKQDTNQLYLLVSFGSGVRKHDLLLIAVAENLRDTAVLPVTVEAMRNDAPPDRAVDEGQQAPPP